MNKYLQAFLDDNNLKVGEKFELYTGSNHYYFSNDGNLKYDLSTGENRTSSKLADVLNNEYRIKKLSLTPTEKFIPEEKEEYWFVDRYGNIDFGTYHKAGRHDYIIAHTLIFKTKEQAEDYKWFLDKVDEYKKPFVIFEKNSYVYYNRENEEISTYFNDAHQVQGVIYFGSEDNINAFIEEVGEERIKKYMFDIWN